MWVYIHSPDRLARKFVYQEIVLEELKGKGVEVVFLNRRVAETPEDNLLLGVQGIIAEYERANSWNVQGEESIIALQVGIF